MNNIQILCFFSWNISAALSFPLLLSHLLFFGLKSIKATFSWALQRSKRLFLRGRFPSLGLLGAAGEHPAGKTPPASFPGDVFLGRAKQVKILKSLVTTLTSCSPWNPPSSEPNWLIIFPYINIWMAQSGCSELSQPFSLLRGCRNYPCSQEIPVQAVHKSHGCGFPTFYTIIHINKYIFQDELGSLAVPHLTPLGVIPRKLCCCSGTAPILHSQPLFPCYPYISYSWNDWGVELELLLHRRDAG